MRALRPGVLLDVDGTLVDTNYLHALAWARAFRDAGEWVSMHAVHRLVGMDSEELVSRLLGHASPDAVAARPGRYRELAGDITAFPGARDLLAELHRRDLVVVLATSAPRDELEVLGAILDADDHIDGHTSADDVEEAKPSPEVFRTAMASFGVDPRLALAVGDSVWDVEAARAAGIGCIAVESGGFSRHELNEVGAVAVYRDVHELLDQLALSPIANLFPATA